MKSIHTLSPLKAKFLVSDRDGVITQSQTLRDAIPERALQIAAV